MFSSVLARSALKTTRIASRSASSGSAVWGKSNMRYVTFVIAGAVVTEAAFGTVSNFIWDTVNQGKLYKQINWSRFKTDDDEE